MGLTLGSLAWAALTLSVAAGAAESGPQKLRDTPIRWKGVEVITNDFDSVEHVRRIAGLAPDSLLAISDPKLQSVCDAVRAARPQSKVACSNVISATPGGLPHAWYLIEVDIAERKPLACRSGSPLAAELSDLVNEWQQSIAKAILEGADVSERVNDREHLDYTNGDLSALAARLHAATRDRAGELESAGAGCDPGERAESFYLMTFAGDPQRFIPLAGAHINDSDISAANAATRFLMVFADFVSPTDIPALAAAGCRSALEGGFTARNKSLALLNAWRKSGALSFAQLGSDCQQQVRNIARTSVADPIAIPAQELMRRGSD